LDNYGGGNTDLLGTGVGSVISFPSQDSGFRIEKAGQIYYMGSFKAHYKGDLFSESYTIEEVKTPSELEVMQKLLPNAKGSPWEPIIENRIDQLSAQKAQ